MKRLTSMLAAAVLGATLLTSCGGGTDAYCDTLKDTQKNFDDFAASDFSDFDQFVDRVDKLTDEAPDEVKDDWKVLQKAFNGFVDALDKAGLKPEDLEKLSNGEVPEGVDLDALTAAMDDIQALDSDDFEKAQKAIEKHAKDECNVELDAS